MNTRLTLGSLETVSIPAFGVIDVLAKVDTGAFSGALHCTDIHISDGVLHFSPLGKKRLATSTHEFEERTVRSASGHKEIRYLIPITLEIRDKSYKTLIGLSDRAIMKRDLLIGRRFLLEHNGLVDVSLTRDIDDEAERLMA